MSDRVVSMRAAWLSSVAALCVSSVSLPARADDPLTAEEAQARADEVEIDTKGREIRFRRNVEIALPPFVLRSEDLTVSRGPRGLQLQGDGHLDFCPCLGTPISLGFSGASVAPPGDLFLSSPTLRVFGVPVFYVPYFWLRSPARAGLLPPRIAYRGSDGLFIGGGVQYPFSSTQGKRTWPLPEATPDRTLVIRAGGYTAGGAAVTLGYYSEASTNLIEWDVRGRAGMKLSLSGSDPLGNGKLAYEMTAYRGARAIESTTDFDQASRAYDRARLEVREQGDSASVRTYGFGAVSAIGLRGRPDVRGMWAGPTAGAGIDIPLGSRFSTHADVDAMGRGRASASDLDLPAAEANDVRSLAVLRGSAMVEGTIDGGPLDIGVAGGGIAAMVGGEAHARSAQIAFARVEPSIPLGRAYGDLLHRLEPGLVAMGAIERHDDVPEAVIGPWPDRKGGVGAFGAKVRSVLGTWGARDGFSLDAMGGALVDRDGTDPLVRGRATWGTRYFGVAADGGATLGSGASTAALGTLRIGPKDRASIFLRAAHRRGSRTESLRLLDADEAWVRRGYLSSDGLTGAATFRATAGAFALMFSGDGDLDRRSLLGLRGELVVQDHCECIAVRLGASQRIGRDGVDAWVLFDFGDSVRRYRK